METANVLAKKNKFKFKELFRMAYFKPLGISMGLMFAQQFSGINAVMFYSVSIFRVILFEASVKLDFTLVKLEFTCVKPEFTCVKLDFTCVKLDFASLKLNFTPVKLDFSCAKLHFACVKLDFTCVKLDFTSVKLDFASAKLDFARKTDNVTRSLLIPSNPS